MLRRIHPEPTEPMDEQKAEIERLRTGHDELATMEEHEWTDELVEVAETTEVRFKAIEADIDGRARFRRRTSRWEVVSPPSGTTERCRSFWGW